MRRTPRTRSTESGRERSHDRKPGHCVACRAGPSHGPRRRIKQTAPPPGSSEQPDRVRHLAVDLDPAPRFRACATNRALTVHGRLRARAASYRAWRAILVAISGYGHDEDQERAHQAGFHVHVTKPVDPDRLSADGRLVAPSPELNESARARRRVFPPRRRWAHAAVCSLHTARATSDARSSGRSVGHIVSPLGDSVERTRQRCAHGRREACAARWPPNCYH